MNSSLALREPEIIEAEVVEQPDLARLLSALGTALEQQQMPRITLRTAIDALLENLRKNNRRESYVVSVRQYLNKWALFLGENKPIADVTVHDINRWFDERKENPAGRRSNAGRISTLFSFCKRRDFVKENPCAKLEYPFIDKPEPKILTVEQCQKLFHRVERCKPKALAGLTLALMVGIRPHELKGIGWSDISDTHVKVSATAAKTRSRRMVRLEPAASEWLERARALKATLPISHMSWRRYVKYFRSVLNWSTYSPDVLRHTACTMLLQLKSDIGYVAFNLGNSPRIIKQSYYALIPDPTCGERFFQIRPQPIVTLLEANDPHGDKVEQGSVSVVDSIADCAARLKAAPTKEAFALARSLATFGKNAASFVRLAGQDTTALQNALRGLRQVIADTKPELGIGNERNAAILDPWRYK